MIKGFYSAASAMMANISRQQLISHNISNLDTPGFKQILSTLDEFTSTGVVESNSGADTFSQKWYAGELGLGVQNGVEYTDFAEGSLKVTGNELDLAIAGDGFFRIQTPDGERYTRDGRFIRDAGGNLVTSAGHYVLNTAGQKITLPEGDITIDQEGVITVDEQQVGQIGLAAFTNPGEELERADDNTFSAAAAPTSTTYGTIQQKYLEMPNVNAAQIATQLVMVGRSYEAAAKMVSTQDELLGRSISALGRGA